MSRATLPQRLADLSAFAASVNDDYWRDKLKAVKPETLRTLATFFKAVEFGGAKDPSSLAGSVLRELARRRAVKTKPKPKGRK